MELEKQLKLLLQKINQNTKIKSYEILEKKGLIFSKDMQEEYLQLVIDAVGIQTPVDGEEWELGAYYKKGSIVEEKGRFFKCKVSHISNFGKANLENNMLWQKRN